MLSVAACKATRAALRIAKRGGTALPGKAAMAVQKNILEVVSDGMEIVVVTGTNGKTTTCRMIEHALTKSGKEVLANKSGANLLSGVTAEFTANADALGRPRKKYAVIECDEGALKQVVPLIHPKAIVVTNLFRDQLDRYGEVLHTLEQVRLGVMKAPDAVLCLNADCSLTSSLALQLENDTEGSDTKSAAGANAAGKAAANGNSAAAPRKILYYGISTPVDEQKESPLSDATHCIRCGAKYEYKYHTYAHLGGFYCPNCGYSRSDPEVAVTEISEITPRGSRIRVRMRPMQEQAAGAAQAAQSGQLAEAGAQAAQSGQSVEEKDVFVALPAVYNIYNAAGAIAAFRAMGYDTDEMISALADVGSSFGRMETFELGESPLQMILVKNPAGCNQAIEYVAGVKEPRDVVLCLNDRTADGHDISWIWDADYEKIAAEDSIGKFYVSGDRAEDMQLRLKYAGAPEEKIELVRDYNELAEKLGAAGHPAFILPNYTSMLALRAVLSEKTGKGEFWKG